MCYPCSDIIWSGGKITQNTTKMPPKSKHQRLFIWQESLSMANGLCGDVLPSVDDTITLYWRQRSALPQHQRTSIQCNFQPLFTRILSFHLKICTNDSICFGKRNYLQYKMFSWFQDCFLFCSFSFNNIMESHPIIFHTKISKIINLMI